MSEQSAEPSGGESGTGSAGDAIGSGYAELAGRLQEVAELSLKDWLALSRELWKQNLIPSIAGMQNLLDMHSRKPRYWAKDVEKYISRLKSGMNQPEDFIPWELHGQGTLESAYELWKILMGNYAGLLMHWPQIWDVMDSVVTKQGFCPG